MVDFASCFFLDTWNCRYRGLLRGDRVKIWLHSHVVFGLLNGMFIPLECSFRCVVCQIKWKDVDDTRKSSIEWLSIGKPRNEHIPFLPQIILANQTPFDISVL